MNDDPRKLFYLSAIGITKNTDPDSQALQAIFDSQIRGRSIAAIQEREQSRQKNLESEIAELRRQIAELKNSANEKLLKSYQND